MRDSVRPNLKTTLSAIAVSLAVSAFVSAHGPLHAQIEEVSRRIAQAPREAALYLKRGELHRLHTDWAAALADYRRARLLDPRLDASISAKGGRCWRPALSSRPGAPWNASCPPTRTTSRRCGCTRAWKWDAAGRSRPRKSSRAPCLGSRRRGPTTSSSGRVRLRLQAAPTRRSRRSTATAAARPGGRARNVGYRLRAAADTLRRRPGPARADSGFIAAKGDVADAARRNPGEGRPQPGSTTDVPAGTESGRRTPAAHPGHTGDAGD